MNAYLTYITENTSDTFLIPGDFPSIEEAVAFYTANEAHQVIAALSLRFATPTYQLFERGPVHRKAFPSPPGLAIVALSKE